MRWVFAMIVIVMGVSGSGKTTIAQRLADALGCEYLEGDTLHPASNIALMEAGIPLTDETRAPWLAAVRRVLEQASATHTDIVVTCSALREKYRRQLDDGLDVTWIYLRGPASVIRERLSHRTHHFFHVELLDSQLADLEEPAEAVTADITLSPESIVQELLPRITRARAVHVSATLADMSAHAADALAEVLRATVARKGRCSLVLSGGDTPRGMHRALASSYRETVPWRKVHIFWSDERYVAPDDPRSNAGMARETLLDHVPCPAENIHAMPTTMDSPAAAARAYEDALLHYGDGIRPSFDVAILGVGADGHTASLFPHAAELDECSRLVLPVERADAEPRLRLTLTLPVLLASARSWVLVDGGVKASAVRQALDPSTDPHTVPAAFLERARGGVMWWLDEAAASQLPNRPEI
ncbi:MAG TPA: 6-phosphogluconolactonase [Longimicrobiales bacterium]